MRMSYRRGAARTLAVMNGGSPVMNDSFGPVPAEGRLTGTGNASDSTFCGRPQIHSGADAVRHRDRVRHLVHGPGVLDGQARAAPDGDAERGRASARAESR